MYGVFPWCWALCRGLCVEDLPEAPQQLAVLGTPDIPAWHPGRGGRGGRCLLGAQLGSGALGLNPTRPLPDTTTLSTPSKGSAAGIPGLWPGHWVCPPSEVVHTTSPCSLFPQSYTPTVFERLNVNLQMKGKPVNLQIWDTAGRCAGLGVGWKEGPRCWEPSPTPFLLNQQGQPISRGQVWARIRAPRD